MGGTFILFHSGCSAVGNDTATGLSDEQ